MLKKFKRVNKNKLATTFALVLSGIALAMIFVGVMISQGLYVLDLFNILSDSVMIAAPLTVIIVLLKKDYYRERVKAFLIEKKDFL